MAHRTPEELKEKALAVMARLREIKEAGRGTIPIQDLLNLFGTPSSPELLASLKARGQLEFVFKNGDGTFRNQGPAFSTEFGPGLLEVPPVLAGTVELNATQMVLSFEPEKRMVGKAMFVELDVEKIEVSEHHVAVRLPGGIFDQEYQF